MFKILNNNTIEITRGDTGVFTLDITHQDGTPCDYSNDTVLLTVKQNVYTTDFLIQKHIQYGENIVIEPSDTQELNYGDRYVYDVQLTTAGGIVDTIIPPSKFVVLQEVTF